MQAAQAAEADRAASEAAATAKAKQEEEAAAKTVAAEEEAAAMAAEEEAAAVAAEEEAAAAAAAAAAKAEAKQGAKEARCAVCGVRRYADESPTLIISSCQADSRVRSDGVKLTLESALIVQLDSSSPLLHTTTTLR